MSRYLSSTEHTSITHAWICLNINLLIRPRSLSHFSPSVCRPSGSVVGPQSHAAAARVPRHGGREEAALRARRQRPGLQQRPHPGASHRLLQHGPGPVDPLLLQPPHRWARAPSPWAGRPCPRSDNYRADSRQAIEPHERRLFVRKRKRFEAPENVTSTSRLPQPESSWTVVGQEKLLGNEESKQLLVSTCVLSMNKLKFWLKIPETITRNFSPGFSQLHYKEGDQMWPWPPCWKMLATSFNE